MEVIFIFAIVFHGLCLMSGLVLIWNRLVGSGYFEPGIDTVQNFDLDIQTVLQYIKLEIISNHGHNDYTCLYRFRVHGDVPH